MKKYIGELSESLIIALIISVIAYPRDNAAEHGICRRTLMPNIFAEHSNSRMLSCVLKKTFRLKISWMSSWMSFPFWETTGTSKQTFVLSVGDSVDTCLSVHASSHGPSPLYTEIEV
jgi:hypothetical protein